MSLYFWSKNRVNKSYIDTKLFTTHNIESFSLLTLSTSHDEMTDFYHFARKMGFGVLCVEKDELMTQLVAYSKSKPLPEALISIVVKNAVEPHWGDPAPFRSVKLQDY